jgi:ion channel POLLUX/CASTOR
MIAKRVGIRGRLKYSFDNFMSRGGLSVFLALMCLFVSAIAVVAIFRFAANLVAPQESTAGLANQWWLSFLQIADGGSVAEDTGSNAVNRAVGIVALFLGMVLFSSLVAFITSQFEAMLADLRKGRSDVVEEGHTLILGFGDRVLEIIRELIIANESEKDAAIVVLSGREKDEMDDFFRDRIGNLKTTRLVTRSGSTSSVQLLRRVAVGGAKSVVILNDAPEDAPHARKALADARVLKTILAVISCTGEEEMPPIVAELHLPAKQDLARHISRRVAIIDEHSILAKLMVQTSRISGLAQVYDHVVGFEGNEFYFFKPVDGFGDISYGDLVFHFATCCVLGLRAADGRILINPDPATRLAADDEAILLAEDDSAIVFSAERVKAAAPAAAPAGPRPKSVERQMIVGWNQKAPIIVEEYSKYLVEGSGIDVVVAAPPEHVKAAFGEVAGRHPGIAMHLIEAEVGDPGALDGLAPERYDNVIILSGEGGEAELNDSDTIAVLLAFRQHFRALGAAELKTQLITEIADSENIDVIREAGVHDFLISNQFVSKIYAQVSENQEVLEIYEDLFSEEGSEVYLKPAGLFLPDLPRRVPFADLCAAALARKETCIGVRIVAEEKDARKGFGIHLNPAKADMFSLLPTDCLVTLAEDES